VNIQLCTFSKGATPELLTEIPYLNPVIVVCIPCGVSVTVKEELKDEIAVK